MFQAAGESALWPASLVSSSFRQPAVLEQTARRPWPLPEKPWLMGQVWLDLLFAHWRAPEGALRKVVPRELPLPGTLGGVDCRSRGPDGSEVSCSDSGWPTRCVAARGRMSTRQRGRGRRSGSADRVGLSPSAARQLSAQESAFWGPARGPVDSAQLHRLGSILYRRCELARDHESCLTPGLRRRKLHFLLPG